MNRELKPREKWLYVIRKALTQQINRETVNNQELSLKPITRNTQFNRQNSFCWHADHMINLKP